MDNKIVPSTTNSNAFIRGSGLGAVVGPVLFVVMFTTAGFLRPSYSPVHQAISDLGVEPMPWLLNTPLVVLGFLLVVLAFAPGSPLITFHIAGLAERLLLVEILAWYVVMGWRLFRTPIEN